MELDIRQSEGCWFDTHHALAESLCCVSCVHKQDTLFTAYIVLVRAKKTGSCPYMTEIFLMRT